ncbi:RHS repeat-associated core domain-containing protein [Zhenpiania hominis]|uniref:RHS repeat-associated core domain-containing protein n=1 Tax=Zhenpiania hominis TaxID=2763644 RepID=UPI0039F4FD6D
MKRGRIVGTAKDTWLKGWTLSWKKASAGEDAWKEFKKGTRAVTEGELGILDLNGAEFAEGTDYQVRLEVTDRAGNRSEATHTFQKDSQEAYIRILPASLTIKRPFWEQDSQSPTFTLSADTKKLELTAKESVDLSKGTTTWYVDNQKTEGENTCLNRDFSAWQDKKAHRILAIHQDGDGNLSYSRDVRENDLQKNVSFGETAATSMEQTVKVDQDTVSLRLQASQPGASYEVKAEGGTYQTATPGKTIRVAELLPEAAYANTFTIRVSLEAEAVMQPVVLELDTIEEESFTVSSLYNYLPQTGSMKHQLNDRAYLYWDNLLPEGDDSLSYNVYHSTEKDFTPSRKTLAAEHVKAGYYSEINVNYGKPFYYRITVVKRDANGNVISESAPSELISGKLLDYNEHTKRLGLQDYWQYEEFNNPVGSGSVEKSSGNFVYQQTDAELPNEKLEIDLTRTYNSQSSQKSAFGLGWTHNYDLQLLNVYDEKAESFDNVVLKDRTGSIFRFTRSTDPKKAQTYISQAGEYLTLTEESKTEKVQVPERKVGTSEEDTMRTVEVASQYTMRTKDNLEYRFNGGGQLVYLTEPNGSFLLFEYEGERGLLKKATTNRGLAMEFVYENGDPKDKSTDMLLIKQIKLPDGSKREYQYEKKGEHSLLTKVIATGKDGKSISYIYEYDSAENPNVKTIKDAEENSYTLEYTDEKVTEAVYPDQEGLSFVYSDAEESQTKTEITRFDGTGFLTGGKEISKTCGYYEDSTGYCLKDINANGKETEYVYEDGICIFSSWNTMAYAIGEDGVIRGTETDHREWTDIGERRNETTVVSEDGSTANYTYYADTSDLDIQDLIYHEETLDADGEVTEEHYYEYDEWGNEIEDYDAFEDVTIVSDYYEDEEDEEFAGELETETEYFGDREAGEEIRTTSYTYAYDSEGSKTETETEICGSRKTETVTTYDAMGQETSVVSRSGAASKTLGAADVDSSVTTEYDSFGRAVKETSVEGAVTTVTENEYDDNGTLLCEKVVTSDKSQTRTIETTYTYDERNRQATRTVNDNGEIQVFTTSYGYKSVLVHASNGTGTRLVENAYRTEERKQDGSSDGYLISQTYQDGAGNTIRAKENGLYTDTLYDAYGTELGTYEAGKQADAEDGLLTLKVPDKNGNILATVQKPVFRDGAWRIAEDSIVTTATYDSSGKETSNTDAMGNTTKYGYDSKGELNLVTVPEGGKTAFDTKEVYVNGELRTSVKTTDAKENISETVTNEEGQELEITDHYKKDGEDQSIQSLYTYDEKGRLSEKKEAKGNSVTYEYDISDRVAKVQYYETVDGTKTQTLETAYTYDVNGNVTRMCDYEVKDGARTLYRTTVYAYDPQNRLTSMAEWDGGELPTQEQIAQKKITYTYDGEGKVTGVDYAFAKDDGITGLTYTYDNDDYLKTITAKGGLLGKTLREYVYDDFGRVTKMKDYYGFAEGGSDHILREYTYDDFGRVAKMTYTDSKDGEVKESYGYTYDKNSNILQERIISHYAAADGKELDCTRNYTYDKNGRLTKAEVIDHTEGGAGSGTTEYTYDLAGTRDKDLTPEGLRLDYHYNGLNQLFLIETKEQDDTGEWQVRATETYTYDRNGNQTGKTSSASGETVTMNYDAANRLTDYEKEKDGATLLNQKNRYNGEGQRIRKEETKGTESSVRNYYYQDDSVLYATDGENQRDSFNLLGLESNIIATARGTGSSEAWYLYNKDVRGSTSSLIDDSGTVAAAYEYDEFGNTTARIGENFDNEICYTGQVYDKETGLYYYNARFYDPEDGRFLTQDTYRGEQIEPGTWHLYAYCANDPVNFIDESGNRRKKRKSKNETLGWGVTIQASIGQIISSASVGLDVVWFNSNVDTRYKNKSTHVFWHIDSDISAGLEKNFKKILKKKKTKIYSLDGLKEIKKSLKKNARFNGALSALFFRVYAKKDKVNTYKDFEGSTSNASFSLAHFTAAVGWSGKCKTQGVGITTSVVGAAGGTSDYHFTSKLTNSFRGVFSRSKVKKTAKK